MYNQSQCLCIITLVSFTHAWHLCTSTSTTMCGNTRSSWCELRVIHVPDKLCSALTFDLILMPASCCPLLSLSFTLALCTWVILDIVAVLFPAIRIPGNTWALQQAKHNLINNYFVVGVTEQIPEYIAVLEASLPRFFKDATKHYLTGRRVSAWSLFDAFCVVCCEHAQASCKLSFPGQRGCWMASVTYPAVTDIVFCFV